MSDGLTRIVGWADITCFQCDGSGAYWIVGARGEIFPGTTEPDSYEVQELIDPCDECHGTGKVASPIHAEASDG